VRSSYFDLKATKPSSEETERKLRETRGFAASLRKHLTRWKAEANQRGSHAADFCKLIEAS
jgi:hypothetical protein